jgi:hypothetical protein
MAETGGYRALFADRRFSFFLGQLAVGDAGYAVYSIAILWLALEVSGSAFVAALVLALEFGIYALSFLAGPYVDRSHNPRNILLAGYPLQALCAFAIGFLAANDALSVPLLLGLVVAISFLWDFTYTASLAILPRIVPPDRLFLANGLTSAVSGGNQIAGYAIGAGLLLLVGTAGAMYLYAALNLVAAAIAVVLTVPPALQVAGRVRDEFVAGWRYLFAPERRPLLELAGFSAIEAFFSTAFVLIILQLANTEFADPSLSYGLLFTAFALGGVAGSLALGRLNPRRRLAAILIGATLAEGVGLVGATALAPALAPSLVAWFLVGGVEILFFTTQVVYIQATTPRELTGRTLANVYVFRGSSRAVGAVVVGAFLGIVPTLALATGIGLVLLLVAGVGTLAFPKVRRLAF